MVSTSLTFLEANTATFPVSSDNWLEMKSFLENIGSNRHLRAQTLTVSFKKPFDLLAENTVAVRNAPDDFSRISKWWCLLEKVRTHFDENPV